VYRFTVSNNKIDHKFIVVFFGIMTLLLGLFLSTVWAIIFCVFINIFSARLVWLKMCKYTPSHGVIILDGARLQFESDSLRFQGEVTTKSRLFYNSVWLHLQGFNQHHWLIILANGVDAQSYARLKRAALGGTNPASELK
jgi:hypothetical protein